jgi:hypothetical protein
MTETEVDSDDDPNPSFELDVMPIGDIAPEDSEFDDIVLQMEQAQLGKSLTLCFPVFNREIQTNLSTHLPLMRTLSVLSLRCVKSLSMQLISRRTFSESKRTCSTYFI